ncbi:MAG: hypothetical protein RLY35_399 [Bacteroidota bacterium]|jgi:hypothetical protein
MMRFNYIWILGFALFLGGCQVNYSFTGGQFSGASNFQVNYMRPQTALASPVYAQKLTEGLKDYLLAQSPLQLVTANGDLIYEGSIVDYNLSPIAAQGNEIASLTRLSITVRLKYTNQKEKELNFEKNFTKYADFPAGQDLFSVQEELWNNINDQLIQEIYNASVGNW